MPLKTFFGRDEADISTFIKSARSEEVLPKVAKIDLGQRIKSLLDKNVFFLKFLTEQPQHNHASGESHEEYHLPQVVALYNRINSAGKRVEAEEKIFATLVSFQPAANQWLSDLFKSVHDPDPGVQERDDILKRRKERNFGFKLFIRAFVQVCAYHFGKPLGNGSFSFGVVNSPLFQEKLLKDGELNPLFERTTKVVKFVRDLLQDGLYCDDLQTLPETTPLLPLFEVLIRFPKLLDAQPRDAKALQCLALRLLLSRDLDIAAGKNRLTDEDILGSSNRSTRQRPPRSASGAWTPGLAERLTTLEARNSAPVLRLRTPCWIAMCRCCTGCYGKRGHAISHIRIWRYIHQS